MTKHYKFITVPISIMLKETIIACSSIGDGIHTHPLSEYVMQSTFLKLTGASEQKLKCILWDLATNNYEFRYEFLKNNFGECSSYSDKNKILKKIVENIEKIDSNFELASIKNNVFDNAKKICDVLDDSIMTKWFCRDYEEFKKILNKITSGQILENANNNIFVGKPNLKDDDKTNSLYEAFECMYKHRNRCAHNLASYQENLPTLSKLKSDGYKYENWFVRFFVLILIDEIFIRLFEYYVELVNKKPFEVF